MLMLTPPTSAHSSSVTPLSRGEQAGAGLTVQEVLEGVTTPCCLLGSCLFDDGTVHLKGKLALCVQRSVFLWVVTYCLCRYFIQMTGLYKDTLVSIRHMILLLPQPFPLVPHFFRTARYLAR